MSFLGIGITRVRQCNSANSLLTHVAQYANIYFLRLALLKPVIMQRAEERWSAHACQTSRVLDVVQGVLTWIVGTIYMDMPLKPQVLQDLVADIDLAGAVPLQSWRDPQKDTIQLEDESGRICITGSKLQTSLLCTGIVVAVLGSETSGEEFEVIDIIFPGIPPNKEDIVVDASSTMQLEGETKSEVSQDREQDEFVALVSGLEIDGTEAMSLSLMLLEEYLTGELLEEADQLLARQISTLILAGNNITSVLSAPQDAMTRRVNKNKKFGYDSSSFNPRPVRDLDNFLKHIAQSMNVVVMPGEKDATNATLPQQPINRIMLQDSSKYHGRSLKLTTNPAYIKVADRTFFGTSGQTINDIAHYVATIADHETVTLEREAQETDPATDDVLGVMESTLHWRHVAPTSPDTLWTYPFADRDPFILDYCPDIYFVGDQPQFCERLVEEGSTQDGIQGTKCRLISLPRFRETCEVVIVNLRTLDVEVLQLLGKTAHPFYDNEVRGAE